jgi:hypothetical protein
MTIQSRFTDGVRFGETSDGQGNQYPWGGKCEHER